MKHCWSWIDKRSFSFNHATDCAANFVNNKTQKNRKNADSLINRVNLIMNSFSTNKIVVIGAGNVGQAIAYTLMIRHQVSDIVIIDRQIERSKSSAKDIAHATGFFTQIPVRAGGYDECRDADLIIMTAGINRKPGQSRLDLARTNVDIVTGISENIMKYNPDPLILVVTNPVDIVTAAVLKITGADKNKIFGSGTILDTARFRFIVSDILKLGVTDVSGFVIGEHGDSHVPIWSNVHIGDLALSEYEKQFATPIDKNQIEEYIKKAGADIIAGKGATFYGIAMAVARIVENFINDKHGIMPLSHKLGEEFGDWAGAVISMPCVIGRSGIEKTIMPSMSDEERKKMDRSVNIIKKMQKELGL